MPLYGDILQANFFDLKNLINQFFGVISPSDIFIHILDND
jgi:hypothetical protein